MALVVDGILTQKLPWGLILIGAFLAIAIEVIGIPSLPVAVGVYLPIVAAAMFLGGVIRRLVDRRMSREERESAGADSGPGVLFSSGLITGGAISSTIYPLASRKFAGKRGIMSSLWMRSGWAALCGMMIVAGVSAAQAPATTTLLVGLVRDSAGKPIPNVEVWLRGSDLHTQTNDIGGFRLPNAPVGAVKITVRRLGFEQTTVDLTLRGGQTDSLVLALTSVAANLPGVLVEDEAMTRSKRLLAGFWDRRARGFGHFYTREDIEKRDPHDFADIVRMTPSVSVVYFNGRKVIRFTRSAGIRGDCPPQYWVDGMRIENATPDEFPPQDVEAIELYAGSATIPPQFAPRIATFRTQTCGAIVIWTRLPGT